MDRSSFRAKKQCRCSMCTNGRKHTRELNCTFCGETKEENFSMRQRTKQRPGCKKCILIYKPQNKSKKNTSKQIKSSNFPIFPVFPLLKQLQLDYEQRMKFPAVTGWKTNETYVFLLLTGYIRTVIKFDTMYSKIPVDIITFCGKFCYGLSQKNKWNSDVDFDIKFDGNDTGLTYMKCSLFKPQTIKAMNIITSKTERKVFEINVFKIGKKDLTFKIGICDESNGERYLLCIANDSFASSDWILNDGDVISTLYYLRTLKFAINGKEYPKKFENVYFDETENKYTLCVKLYDCIRFKLI
eukprot:1205_1